MSRPQILIVDDHRNLRDMLRQYLSQHGFDVEVAAHAAAARKLIDHQAFDLAVLDIMMPGEDGLALCRHLRATTHLPIILLTAVAEDTDRVIGLEMGADDYVTKPFNPRELLARIKAVLRRARSLPQPQRRVAGERLQFDRWCLDVARRELVDAEGVAVPLSTAEFQLLTALIEYPGAVLSRDVLLERTKGRVANVFDRSIDSQISRLRKKIEINPREPELVKTHWGGGYSFTAKVKTL